MKLLGLGVDAAVASDSDIFGRDKFANGLLHLFSSSGDPLVIALDEKWGAGKTVFAKRLAKSAEKSGHTVVYFDAFRRDYDPDVFIGLTSELLAKFPDDPLQEKSIKEKALAVGRVLGRVGLKVGFRAVTGGLGKLTDFDEATKETDNKSENEFAGVLDLEFDRIIDERLSGAKAADTAFQNFKKSLQTLGQSGGENAKPLLFIVDELDRCRPDYALDVLETIKHFFTVPGVHFLLVCDFAQLLASVAARYGLAIESEVYLEKFIDVKVTFPVQDQLQRRNSIALFVQGSLQGMPDDGEKGAQWKGMADFITSISLHKNYSLRRIEKILTQFAVCMAFTRSNQLRLGAVICVLCDLKISNRVLFQKSKSGNLTFKDLDDYYSFDDKQHSWYIKWLRFFFDETIDHNNDEWRSMQSSLWNYQVDNPRDTAIYLANQVVDRVSD